MLCNKCHSVDLPLRSTCGGCHNIEAKAPMMDSMECGDCHLKEQFKAPLVDCQKCHEKRPGLHNQGGHPDASCTDCHKPHGWQVKGREVCLACHTDKKDHKAKEGDCASCHSFVK